ncbi:MAG: TIGR03118 family protein [Armatimonadetes bacterium]|nr:TIGR03118 family protein [Armatimonadota bacterium]MBS1727618.1 TIGR03118 family protein [Armatimonadota bacterium]
MPRNFLRRSQAIFIAAIAIAVGGCGGSSVSVGGANQFVVTNLVADTAGPASHTDPNLVNAWGMAASPTGPWWISDNGTGKTTLYSGDGTVNALVVNVPGVGVANGPVTGQVYNPTSNFLISGVLTTRFIFVTEDGVLSAWNSGTSAVAVNDLSGTGAIYKGLAMSSSGTSLYATNFHSGMVDVFDGSFALVNSFTDPSIPAGYGPFGIQAIGSLIYVSYAKQDANKVDDVKGAGFGYVDVFNEDGTLNKRLVSNGALNAPWGLAKAPSSFGAASNALLVGNFGDGKINAYDATTGNLIATLHDAGGNPIVIDGLWGLSFGNGASAGSTTTLFFTAGPNDESSGLFGSVAVAP